jgi:hypothetical protein
VGNRIGVIHQGEGMVCQPLRLALLIGAITAVAVSPVRANHNQAPCCNSAPTNCCSTAPAMRTITCTECVPETYTVKRTCYRTECRTEQYQTCRTECVPVCKERVCCVVKRVPCMTTQTRKVCKYVTSYQDKTVMKACWSTVQETCMKRQLVCRGHYECREVPCGGGLFGGSGGGLFGGHGHHNNNNCCDPCATTCCTPTRMKKVWVNCPEYRECPVTVCKKVCTMVPTTCKVAVCTPCWSEVTCQVCTYKCVTEQVVQKYTCYETRSVPCTATRTVRVCVPYETTVCCTRMVAKTVCRQVPVSNCCDTGCNNNACNSNAGSNCCPTTSCCTTSCCTTSCCSKPRCGGLFSGMGGGHRRHNSTCCR